MTKDIPRKLLEPVLPFLLSSMTKNAPAIPKTIPVIFRFETTSFKKTGSSQEFVGDQWSFLWGFFWIQEGFFLLRILFPVVQYLSQDLLGVFSLGFADLDVVAFGHWSPVQQIGAK